MSRLPFSLALLLSVSGCGGLAVSTADDNASDGGDFQEGEPDVVVNQPSRPDTPRIVPEIGLPHEEVLFGPFDEPYRRTYSDWLTDYWKWHLAIPRSVHPREGGDCSTGQSGNIWFLTTGTNGEPTTRSCTVPAGVALFFVLNAGLNQPSPDCRVCSPESHSPEAWYSSIDFELDALAARLLPNEVRLEIDGVSKPVGNDYFYRADEPFFVDAADLDPYFNCIGPLETNLCGWQEGDERPFTAVGYAAMLRPFSPGSHTIRFGALGEDGEWDTDVTYEIEVLSLR